MPTRVSDPEGRPGRAGDTLGVMADLRIYRAAFVPLALVVVIVAFSLGGRPRPLSTQLAPDAFDGPTATRTLQGLATTYPDRRPGSAGDEALARHVGDVFRAAGLRTSTYTFTGDTVAGRRSLVNVVGTRQGGSSRQLVIVAHRDARSGSSPAELSGTAGLLELVRVLSGRVTQRTVTVVSTSGGSGGGAGAAALADELRGPVDAVIVLGDLAGRGARRPYVVPWSDGGGLAPIKLRRTVDAALQTELGSSPGGTAATDQVARLAFQVSVSEQGRLLAAGLPAVLVQQSGEVGPRPGDRISTTRLQAMGRGVLRALTALDTGPDTPGSPTRDVLVGSRVVPGWAVRLLVLALLTPALVAAVDMLARARRRRERLGLWLGWLAAGAVPFLVAALFAAALGRTGLLRAAPAGPVTDRQLPIGLGGTTALISVAVVFGLAWALRRRIAGRGPLAKRGPVSQGAAAAMAGTVAVMAFLVWLANPFAAALLVMPLHLWILAATREPAPGRLAGWAVVVAGLVPLGIMIGLDAARLSLGPGSFAWSGLLLVAGGHVGLLAILIWSMAGGCLVAALLLVDGRAGSRPPDRRVTVRGPVSYAGPGSLGGTDSALRR